MDPARLRDIMAELRKAGVRSAKVPCGGDNGTACGLLEIAFGPEPEPPPAAAIPEGAVLIDKRTGKPVDLDEGAPDLARDPGEAIASANFLPKP